MARFIITTLVLFIEFTAVQAQNFPDAQKQPRQKEMRRQHRKFRRQAHRRHIRRGTAYFQFDNTGHMPLPVYMVADDRKLLLACN